MTDVIWNEGALRELLAGPNGPVARDLALRAIRVESAAKQLLNTSYPPASAPGEPPHKRTTRLQTSISWRVLADGEGIYADIGSGVFYAKYLELGTERMAARPFLRTALESARYPT